MRKIVKINKCISIIFLILSICALSFDSAADPTISIQEVNYNVTDMRWCIDQRTIVGPHWVKNATAEPIVFPYNNNVGMGVLFNLSEPWDCGTWPVFFKATGTDGLSIPQFTVYVSLGATQLEAYNIATTQTAGLMTSNKIGNDGLYFEWSYSLDEGDTWLSAGTTLNSCYVTLGSLTHPWINNPVYVEIMELACMGMAGQGNESGALQALGNSLYPWMKYLHTRRFTYDGFVNDFHIRTFISESTQDHGPNRGNDCRDFACVYECLASAVGISSANLSISHKNYPNNTFQTRWLRPANMSGVGTPTKYPFLYHVYNYRLESSVAKIADCSHKMDLDWDEDHFDDYLYANLDINRSDYHSRLSLETLVKYGDSGTCVNTETQAEFLD
jgi:hypothetical protein